VNQTASSNPGSEIAGTTHDAAYHSAHAVQRPASNIQRPSPPFPFLSPQTPSLYSASLHFIPHFFQQDAACSPRRALGLLFRKGPVPLTALSSLDHRAADQYDIQTFNHASPCRPASTRSSWSSYLVNCSTAALTLFPPLVTLRTLDPFNTRS
jgi:hypothetical protein